MKQAPVKNSRPRVAIHKFTSCDGCQLALLNLGEPLLDLWQQVEVVHFAEAGPVNPDAEVDVALVEGSVSTPDEIERIKAIRARSGYLVAMGACATSGGIQALRNGIDADWFANVYADPGTVRGLDHCDSLSRHVRVDHEIYGCPVTGAQVLSVVTGFVHGVAPPAKGADRARDSLCMECKRAGNVCVLVTGERPCLGPVTAGGCGALCPGMNRDCYGCFGAASGCNPSALAARFAQQGMEQAAVRQRFAFIHSAAAEFAPGAVARAAKPSGKKT